MKDQKLKILYITQKVDFNDDLLAAIHSWLEDLAGKVNKLYIVCLYKGEVKLPDNCQVFSLGKEQGISRLKYILKFYKVVIPLIFTKKINGIFIHMNEIYIFLLLPLRLFLKIFNIPIVWWKAHGKIINYSKLALNFVDRVVTSAPSAFKVKTPKKRVIGQGIDIQKFKPLDVIKENKNLINIIAIGRLSPVRNYELLLKAVRQVLDNLPETKLKVSIYGGVPQGKNQEYHQQLIKLREELNLQNIVSFKGAVPNHQLPRLINQADFVVNPGGSNSLDKAIVETMACQRIIIDSNAASWEILEKSDLTEKEKSLFLFKRGHHLDLAEKIKNVINLNKDKKAFIEKSLRQLVVNHHNVDNLNRQILEVFNEVI
ncbi:glycosyltransferase [Patescibacteria group bacterium]|nr:glycosyltransferase [Patescibacteria group bacterium]